MKGDCDHYVYHASVSRDGYDYHIGDCCYLMPSAFDFAIKPSALKKSKVDKNTVGYSCC